MRRVFWSIVIVVLSFSTAAASDIRRVVTGLDATNKAVVIFDSRQTLGPGPYGITSLNLWITDSYPPGVSFKDDPATKPIGISPPDNGTKFRVVEFPPLDAATEAKMEPDFLMKTVGARAPRRGVAGAHPLVHPTRSPDFAGVPSRAVGLIRGENPWRLKP